MAKYGKYGYGHVADPAGHRVTSFRRCAAARASQTPPSASIIPCEVLDQGPTSSCVGHAIACASVSSSLAMADESLAFIPSPDGIYRIARCIDRSGPDEPLVDWGTMPNQAMRGITEWGLRPMRGPTSDGRNSDAEQATINDEPKLGELESDSELALTGYYRIDSVGAGRVNDLRKALAAGFAVCFAIMVDEDFEAYEGQGVLGAPDPNGILGGHYVYATGYRTTQTGQTVVRFRNSWGTGWGESGDGEGDEAFIAGMSDIYVMAVRKRA